MRKIISLIAVFIVLLYATGQSQEIPKVQASKPDSVIVPAEAKFSGSLEINYFRHYLWRGMLFGNNDVSQPVLELAFKDFTLALSENLNYIPKNVPKEIYTKNAVFDEQDVELRYSRTWRKFTNEASAFAYFYFYQAGTPNTAELYDWAGYNFYKDFSFFTENSVDIAAYRGAIYSNNGILYDHTNKHQLQIEWSAYAGFANAAFNNAYYGSSRGGFNLVGSHVDITKSIKKYFIKLMLEKDLYTNRQIKEFAGIRGVENFGIAAGINFK
jgi:hypothetical protein